MCCMIWGSVLCVYNMGWLYYVLYNMRWLYYVLYNMGWLYYVLYNMGCYTMCCIIWDGCTMCL